VGNSSYFNPNKGHNTKAINDNTQAEHIHHLLV
jgi:hypothetical protein